MPLFWLQWSTLTTWALIWDLFYLFATDIPETSFLNQGTKIFSGTLKVHTVHMSALISKDISEVQNVLKNLWLMLRVADSARLANLAYSLSMKATLLLRRLVIFLGTNITWSIVFRPHVEWNCTLELGHFLMV